MLRFAPALFALIAVPASAQPLTQAEVAQIDQAVTKALADTSVPSASIAVVRGGQIVLTKAYGKASERLQAQPNLPYQIASNSSSSRPWRCCFWRTRAS
jgi:CubicO group peptidase (beta-lactamase class C family)